MDINQTFTPEVLDRLNKTASKVISKLMGQHIPVTAAVEKGRTEMLVYLNSEDISSTMPNLFREVNVQTFSSSFNEQTGQVWMTVHLRYTAAGGGSNGIPICTLWINKSGQIEAYRTAEGQLSVHTDYLEAHGYREGDDEIGPVLEGFHPIYE